MNRKVTPQEKKRLSLKKERRSHPNNDKSARKWIPAAKARNRRVKRHAANQIVESLLSVGTTEIDVIDEDISYKEIQKPKRIERIRKDGLESLGAQVSRQLENKFNPLKSLTVPWGHSRFDFNNFMDKYSHDEHYRDFLLLLNSFENYNQKNKITKYQVDKMILWKQSIKENRPFFVGLYEENPGLQKRIARVIELTLQSWKKRHPEFTL